MLRRIKILKMNIIKKKPEVKLVDGINFKGLKLRKKSFIFILNSIMNPTFRSCETLRTRCNNPPSPINHLLWRNIPPYPFP